MTPAAVGTLACPACRGPDEFDGRLAGGKLDSGALRCGRGWPVRDGLPRLIDEDGVRRADRFMRVLYDWFAPLRIPLTRALFPPLQGISERHAACRSDAHRERGLSGIRHSALALPPGSLRGQLERACLDFQTSRASVYGPGATRTTGMNPVPIDPWGFELPEYLLRREAWDRFRGA